LVDQERLFAVLAGTPHGKDWWNPWFGDSEDAQQRRDNLASHLTERDDAPILLVGIAPGHLGARRTGVPMTDPDNLGGKGHEGTAGHVHDVLRSLDIQDRTVLWNIFPFHPHVSGNFDSNRDLTTKEERQFAALVNRFSPRSRAVILSMGRSAESGLNDMNIKSEYVCHPARGKHARFKADVTRQVERLRRDGLV
jgi:hypothetical protein